MIVFYCCKLWPGKKLIEKAVELGIKTAETDLDKRTKLIGEIFTFQDEDGMNCFNILFQSATENDFGQTKNIDIFESEQEINAGCRHFLCQSYRVKSILTNHFNPLFSSGADDRFCLIEEIEKSFFFLKDLGKLNDIDVMKIINRPGNNGRTLYHLASKFSESIMKFLTENSSKVNCISSAFETPLLKVISRNLTVLWKVNLTMPAGAESATFLALVFSSSLMIYGE